MDWDAAYDNRAAVPGFEDILAHWERAAKFFRHDANFIGRFDLPYGDHPRERYDLYKAFPPARGGVIFVHGGYWRALDKSMFTHLAAVYLTQGYDVAIVGYPLVDTTRVPDITKSVTKAIETIAKDMLDPIHLVGHSVGGHLVARQICSDIAEGLNAARKIKSVTTLSGIFDLEPITKLQINEDIKLDQNSAKSESPINYAPLDILVNVWVGEDELQAFYDQSQLLAKTWDNAQLYVAPSRNHFTILDILREPKSEVNLQILNA